MPHPRPPSTTAPAKPPSYSPTNMAITNEGGRAGKKKKEEWSKAENTALVKGLRLYGRRWKRIMLKLLPWRSHGQVKSQGQRLCAKLKKKERKRTQAIHHQKRREKRQRGQQQLLRQQRQQQRKKRQQDVEEEENKKEVAEEEEGDDDEEEVEGGKAVGKEDEEEQDEDGDEEDEDKDGDEKEEGDNEEVNQALDELNRAIGVDPAGVWLSW